MTEQKALTLRLPPEKWEKFKIALIKQDFSAQQYLESKVDELIAAQEQ